MNPRGTSQFWQILDDSILQWILLFLLICVLIWLVVRVRSWFREDEDHAAADHEMLLQFRDLRRQGDLSDAEYRSIKNQLMNRDQHALKLNEAIAHDRQH